MESRYYLVAKLINLSYNLHSIGRGQLVEQ